MENVLTLANLGAAILIIIMYPFAMEIYKESKKVKNEYYQKRKSFDDSHD